MQRRATISRRGVLTALVAMVLAGACSDTPGDKPTGSRPAAGAPTAAPAAVGPDLARPRVVVLGDSLTAGYGLERSQSYPALLQERVERAGYAFEVVNMGVSGDTSAGGVRRADWALEGDVRILILALGANDALRGLPPSALQENLGTIIDRARARGAAVLLCGMEAPPNFGAAHTEAFRQVYRRLAREKEVEFLPFLLEGVAAAPALNQGDGIHPNAAGARHIAELIWPRLEPMLKAAARP
ncbi:MAG: arylesterase [Candidatus Methylomirabilales bacterium]